MDNLTKDTYGGYADETIRFLETIVMLGMSKNDDVLAAKLFRNFRNRIAIALPRRGQCKVINYLISHGTGKNRWSQVVDNSNVEIG